ncbi:hypothetical protein Tco_0856879 [Tanacetum coccineum]|uniref:Uncharacterized protein n=1 Tax=Tanacetum coccineum TaxID=301880 RepID=A0ABQ5B825_9ASTR
MSIIGDEFMQLSLLLMEKLRDKIRIKENKKIQQITKFPDTKESESLVNSKSLESFGVKASLSCPNSFTPKQLCVKYDCTILPSPPLVRESTFGFKPGTKNNQNVKFRQDAKNSLRVLPSFEVYTPLVIYPEEVKETIETPMKVEPLNHTKLEDLGLNTCSHDLFPSSREFPSVDEPKPQLLHNSSPLDVNLGDKIGPKPPIKSHSPDSFKRKVVNHLTIHIPPSPHIASFYPRDVYCYYHPCIDDP